MCARTTAARIARPPAVGAFGPDDRPGFGQRHTSTQRGNLTVDGNTVTIAGTQVDSEH
jgi:hypothetical protein